VIGSGVPPTTPWKRSAVKLAFPDNDYLPTEVLESLLLTHIPLDIAVDLLFPELGVVLWPDKVFAAFMLMPEATVDKNASSVFGKNNVW
jgi:hypothetical protein